MDGFVVGIALGQQVHCAPVFRIQSTASKNARVGTALRPGRLSGMRPQENVLESDPIGHHVDESVTGLMRADWSGRQLF